MVCLTWARIPRQTVCHVKESQMATVNSIGSAGEWQEPENPLFWLGDRRGSALTNRDPQKRQIVYRSAGIDWLSFWVHGAFRDLEETERLFRLVEEARRKAEEENHRNKVFVEYAGEVWRVLPGCGEATHKMKFQLNRGCVSIGFRCAESGGGPVASVEMTGKACSGRKASALGEYALGLLEKFGVNVTHTRMRRADLSIDVSGVYVAEFKAALLEGRCVHRGKCSGEFYDESGQLLRTTGFGANRKSNLQCVIYDKSVQLREPGNEEERAAFLEAWRLEDVPPGLVRLEFRVHREAFENDDLSAFLRKPGIYFRTLMTSWLRFTDQVVDRRAAQRFKAGEVWAGLRDFAVAFVNGEGLGEIGTPGRPRVLSQSDTEAQLLGLVVAWAAEFGCEMEGDQAFLLLYDRLFKREQDAERNLRIFREKLAVRRLECEVRAAGLPGIRDAA